MKRLRVALLFALAPAAACSDEATAPKLAASVQILSSTEPLDERTIGVGDTVRLTASPRDAAGKQLPGRPVRWTSNAPAVASVDSTGLVRGLALGTALIVATADASADTARINVAAPLTGPVACSPGQTGLTLEVGQMLTTTPWEMATLCFAGGVSGAEYLLVPFHHSRSAGGQKLPLELASSGVVPVTDRSTSLAATSPAPEERGARLDQDFHVRLRQRVLPELTRRMGELQGSAGPSPLRSMLAAEVPRAGDRLRLNVEVASRDGCSSPSYRTGRVVAVTQHAVVVADTANPGGGFTPGEYRSFGEEFDRLVYPMSVEQFGAPSDIDRNQRVIIFFTSAVNDLTSAGAGYYVGGYFYDRDLFPKSGQNACAGSNAAEMFYMMVPDSARQAEEPVFAKASVGKHTLAVIAHEFQHLINASRRLHINKAPQWEELWLNEGLSHIAEELLFYRASGLAPGGNEDGRGLSSERVRQAMLLYQLTNVERYVQFLRVPHTASPLGSDELPTRGAIWSFLRYAADRRGGDQQAMWYRLVNSQSAGIDNLNQVLGADAVSWMRDWTLSLYLDDSSLKVAGPYDQPSWNFRQLLPRLRDDLQSSVGTRYPLRTLHFEWDNLLRLNLPSGSAAFVRIGVPARQRAAVRLTSGELPPPEKLKLTVVRTR